MRTNETQEQLVKVRMQNIEQDIKMLDSKKERLESDRSFLILKLVAQREQLLALKEQDE